MKFEPSDLTPWRMDAATNKIVEKVFESCLDPENSVDYEKALKIAAKDGFLVGMKAAAKLKHPARDLEATNWGQEGWDHGGNGGGAVGNAGFFRVNRREGWKRAQATGCGPWRGPERVDPAILQRRSLKS